MSQPIAFANRNRTLVYDIEAMLALEAAAGKNTTEILADLARISFGTLILALWAGFKHDDKNLTPKIVKQHLEHFVNAKGADLKALRKAVADGIEQSNWYQQLTAEDAADVVPEDDAGN